MGLFVLPGQLNLGLWTDAWTGWKFSTKLFPLWLLVGDDFLARRGFLHTNRAPHLGGRQALHSLVYKTSYPLFPVLGNGEGGVKTKYYILGFICFLSAWRGKKWFTLISVHHGITECLPGQDSDTATSPQNLCALCCTRCVELQAEKFLLWALPFFPALQADGWWYWRMTAQWLLLQPANLPQTFKILRVCMPG